MNNLPAKPRRGRPTKAEALQRTRECAAMLLNAKPRSEIIDYFCTTYNLQETSVGNIVTNAYKYISETHTIDSTGLIMTHVQYYYELYNIAKGIGDTKGAVQSLQAIEKVLKLTLPDTAIQNNNIILDMSKLSTEELKEFVGQIKLK